MVAPKVREPVSSYRAMAKKRRLLGRDHQFSLLQNLDHEGDVGPHVLDNLHTPGEVERRGRVMIVDMDVQALPVGN